jgi:hypothetical protein
VAVPSPAAADRPLLRGRLRPLLDGFGRAPPWCRRGEATIAARARARRQSRPHPRLHQRDQCTRRADARPGKLACFSETTAADPQTLAPGDVDERP